MPPRHGEIDYIIKAAVGGMDDMRHLIDRLMPFGDVSTSIVILSPIAYRPVTPLRQASTSVRDGPFLASYRASWISWAACRAWNDVRSSRRP
jgi:hypothetical protein